MVKMYTLRPILPSSPHPTSARAQFPIKVSAAGGTTNDGDHQQNVPSEPHPVPPVPPLLPLPVLCQCSAITFTTTYSTYCAVALALFLESTSTLRQDGSCHYLIYLQIDTHSVLETSLIIYPLNKRMTTVFVEQPLAKAVGLLNIQAIFKNGSVQYEPIQ